MRVHPAIATPPEWNAPEQHEERFDSASRASRKLVAALETYLAAAFAATALRRAGERAFVPERANGASVRRPFVTSSRCRIKSTSSSSSCSTYRDQSPSNAPYAPESAAAATVSRVRSDDASASIASAFDSCVSV